MADQTDAGGAYPSMPPIQPEPEAQVGPAPAPVARAVQLMFASAALAVLGIIMTFVNRDAIRQQVIENNPSPGSDVDTVVNGTIVFSVIVGIVSTALWIWLAMMVRNGKNWARIVTWVLAGVGLLLTIGGLLNPVNALTAILSVIGGLLYVGIIALLATAPSNQFFKGAARV